MIHPKKKRCCLEFVEYLGGGLKDFFYILIPWVVPLPSNSDHQDDMTFLVGDPYKPSFPLLLGRGTTQLIPGEIFQFDLRIFFTCVETTFVEYLLIC